MATTKLYSNELRVVVVPANILTMKSVLQEHFAVVEKFNYECTRQRNNRGQAYGPTDSVLLEFSIRLNNPIDAKPFYECLASNEHFTFSFVFNAVFDANTNLKDYEDGMLCEGYVVSIKEKYSNAQDKTLNGSKRAEASDEQMQLSVTLLLTSSTYLGRDKNIISEFIQ